MKELEKRFESNKEKRKAFRQSLKDRIDSVVGRFGAVRKQTLVRELAKEQVALVLRRNEVGLIYRLTFIDHKNRTVFNGSDLGKGYAANAIMGIFSDRDGVKVNLRREVQGNFLERELGLGVKSGKERIVY